jgi:hypothetical protein
MRNKAIKGILFSLASVTGVFAFAGELPQGLYLIEELPIEQRVEAHKQVLKFLNAHPELAADAKVIAVDEKGTVYVLDEKMEKVFSAGAPSCIGSRD